MKTNRYLKTDQWDRHYMIFPIDQINRADPRTPVTLGDQESGIFYVWAGALSGFQLVVSGTDEKPEVLLTHRCGWDVNLADGEYVGNAQEFILAHREAGCQARNLGVQIRDRAIVALQEQVASLRRELADEHRAWERHMDDEHSTGPSEPQEPPAPENVPGYQAPTLNQCGTVQVLWREATHDLAGGYYDGAVCHLGPDHDGAHSWEPDHVPDARGPGLAVGIVPGLAVGIVPVYVPGPPFPDPLADELAACAAAGPNGATCQRTKGHENDHAVSGDGGLVKW